MKKNLFVWDLKNIYVDSDTVSLLHRQNFIRNQIMTYVLCFETLKNDSSFCLVKLKSVFYHSVYLIFSIRFISQRGWKNIAVVASTVKPEKNLIAKILAQPQFLNLLSP